MFWAALGVALPSIMSEYLINESQAGWLYSSRILPMAVLLTPTGYLADRLGQKKFLIAGYLLIAFGVIMIGFSKDYLECAFSLVIAGAGAGMMVPSYYSLMGAALRRVRGFAIGLAQSAFNVGGLLGSVVIGLFVAHQQWKLSYTIIGITIFSITVAQFIVVGSPATKSKNDVELKPRASVTKLVKTRNVLITSISAFLGNAMFYTTIAWLPTFLQLSTGLDAVNASYVFGLFMLIGAVSPPVMGALSDRIGRRPLLCIGGISSSAISLFMFSTQYSFWTSVGYSISFGFFSNAYWALLLTISQEAVRKEYVTLATGMTQTLGLIGAAVGPAVAGTLITIYNINQSLIYTITLPALLYSLLALTIVEKRPNS
jgi:MFS family permease